MPTGVVSGCRQICLPVVGVHNKARLLTYLHMSLACLQFPTNSVTFPFPFIWGEGGLAQMQHKHAHSPDNNLHWVCWDRTVWRASYISWRLYFEGLGIGQGRQTWQTHPPLARSGSDVSVSDESQSFSSRSPEGAPGLFLKSYIILLLRGRPAFNIVMIRHC